MKLSVFMITTILFTTPVFSFSLSYKDNVELKKTIVVKDLPTHFLHLYRTFSFNERRMIAGDFDRTKKKEKSFQERLREKLQGYKGFQTF